MPAYFSSIFSKLKDYQMEKIYLLMCEEARKALSRRDLKYNTFPELSMMPLRATGART